MSTDEWIKKVWYVYTMEYYSAIEKGDILPPAATWMDLCCMKLVRQILFDSKLMNKMKKKSRLTNKRENKQEVTSWEKERGSGYIGIRGFKKGLWWDEMKSCVWNFGKQQCARWHSGTEYSCQCRRHGFNPWVRKIPWSGKWQPTLIFLPGKFHGQRSLAGYSPRGCKSQTELKNWTTITTL